MAESSDTMNIIVRLRDQISKNLRNVNKEIKILPRVTKLASRGFDHLKSRMAALKGAVFSLQTAIAGIGVALTVGSFLDVAKTFETLGVQLETIQGSSEKAEKSLKWIADFTATTPYELEEVAGAFVKLEAYGINATKWMKMLGDTASSMGKGIMQTVEMFADAMTGEFERIKEFGAKAKVEGDKVTFAWKQHGEAMTLTADKTADGIIGALSQIFSRFEGGMEKQSKTWSGMMSNLMDQWTMFQKAIMDAGVFKALKDALRDVLTHFENWVKVNQKLIEQKVPEYIKTVKKAISDLWDWVKKVKKLFDVLPDSIVGIAGMGLIGRILLGGPKGFLLALGFVAYKVGNAFSEMIYHVDNFKTQLQKREKEIISIMSNIAGGAENIEKILADESHRKYKFLKKYSDELELIADKLKILEGLELKKEFALSPDEFMGVVKLGDEIDKVVKKAKVISKKIKPILIGTTLSWDAADVKAATEKLLSELDYLHQEGIIKAKEYYEKKKDLLIDDAEAQIAILEELKKVEEKGKVTKKGKVEIDLTKIREYSRAIIAKETELSSMLIQLKRDEGKDIKQLEKEANEEILQQKETMYNALKWKAEGYLEFRIGLLAQEYQEFLKHSENESLALQWLNEQKKLLLDEHLQNTNEGYALLTNLSQRTAEAMEQTFSDYFFDLMEGKFDTWRERLHALLVSVQRIAADVMGQIAKEWLVAGVKKLFSMRQESVLAQQKIAQLLQEKTATLALTTTQGTQIGVVSALTAAYTALAVAKTAAGFAGLSGGGIVGSVVGGVDVGVPAMMASGGTVPGVSPTPKSDNILARLTAGEFVQPVDVVKKYGVDVMEGMRQKVFPKQMFQSFGINLPKSISVPKRNYATGGPVTSVKQGVEQQGEKPPVEVKIVNYTDPSEVRNFLATTDGEDAILNVLSSRQTEVRRLVR